MTGGSRFNAPGTGHDSGSTPFNTETAAQHASNENSGKDSDFFGSAMSFIQKRMADGDSKDDVDEDAVQNAHKEAYDNDNGGKMDSNQMGAAAAMQAFKKFTGGGASGQSESGGDFQSKIMGCVSLLLSASHTWWHKFAKQKKTNDNYSMAMKEATSLFDKSMLDLAQIPQQRPFLS